jgi:hypothetical protein
MLMTSIKSAALCPALGSPWPHCYCSTRSSKEHTVIKTELLIPLCVYTFFLLTMLALLGGVRVIARFRGIMSKEYLRAGVGPPPPNRIVDLHHHFSNQFEIPMLYYIGCTLSLFAGSASDATVRWAWCFVGVRFLHTLIVLVVNRPEIRVFPFIASAVFVGFIWGELLKYALR